MTALAGRIGKFWAPVAAALLLAALGAAPFLVNGHNQRQIVADELLSAHVRALFSHTVDVSPQISTRSSPGSTAR
jgi:hypothetical protein